MKKLLTFAVLLVGCAASTLLSQSGGQSVNIPINNPPSGLGYGQTFVRDLGVSPAQLQADPNHAGYYLDGVYVLKFSVQNQIGPYPGYLQGQISFGSQELCPVEGWGIRSSKQLTFVCPNPAYLVVDQALPSGGPAQGSHNLVLTLSVPGWALTFGNDFSLTFTAQSQ